jgi:hypothetical protein
MLLRLQVAKKLTIKMTKQFIILLLALANSIIAFSQNHNYEVYALKFTSEVNIPSSAIAIDGSKTDSVTLVFIVWLIKGGNGKNILVDAGFHKDVEEAKILVLRTMFGRIQCFLD